MRRLESAARRRPRPTDAAALLCALAIDPTYLSRNRNFEVYASTPLRRAHKRAKTLRLLARAAASTRAASPLRWELVSSGQESELSVHDEAIALTRRVRLEELELSLLKALVSLRTEQPPAVLAVEEHDLRRVQTQLASLGLELAELSRPSRCA